ncbi:kinase D-interacting substrate of 220 kDa isoform X3 [Python bivittatus]|uniref:Kinase D-interacting substrate of 220 kDa isoform X3 n=1 Tax=Python bivittatus TaxID=176946 RepID=A0A9F2WEZ7_PYTBI|nr:kinase D-interacting substrate of 220 kDa isoform X3 [Python bivittatus]
MPLQDAAPRASSVFSQPSSACSSTHSFNGPFNGGVVSPQPHSSYYSGMTGPQHPFYNRPFFAPYVYMPRYYPGNSHLTSRPSLKSNLSREQSNGLGTIPGSGASHVPLSSMSVDAVCEKLKQIEGLDQTMLAQYSATIKKANINGRVLAQCNIDELKREMNMNFGDWHLFKSAVLEMRNAESQAVHEDSRTGNEHANTIPHNELTRHPTLNNELPHTELTGLPGQAPYTLNFSFEELNNIGLEEAPPRHSNLSWQSQARRTPSLSSLNSQDSSIEISKLTDKVQAEYRDAYREYIAQMSQLEGGASSSTVSGRSSPHSSAAFYMGQSTSTGSLHSSMEQDKGKDAEQKQDDVRKSFLIKRNDVVDYSTSVSTNDASPLDPITEEDEKSDQSGSKLLSGKKSSERTNIFQAADLKLKGVALRYQKLPSDEDESGTEESDNTPLLKEGKDRKIEGKVEKQSKSPDHGSEPIRTLFKAKEYLTDALLDKKDSSDSGVRSNESSPNHSLHNDGDDSQLEKANLIELEDDGHSGKRGIPHSLSGLQDPTIARMSICSEDKKSPSDSSLIASSPEENWPSCQKVYNLNRTPSTVTLNNNSAPTSRANQNFEEIDGIREPSQMILCPGSSSNSVTVQNDNIKGVTHKRSQRSSYTRLSKDSSELLTVTGSDAAGFGEERESIL